MELNLLTLVRMDLFVLQNNPPYARYGGKGYLIIFKKYLKKKLFKTFLSIVVRRNGQYVDYSDKLKEIH